MAKPMELLGDGHSIAVGGNHVSLGPDVRVVLWNQPARYGSTVRALWKRGYLPAFNFYYGANPFTAGAAGAPRSPSPRTSKGTPLFGAMMMREEKIGDDRYQVATVFWDDKSRAAAAAYLAKKKIFLLHHDQAYSSLGCYQTLVAKNFSVHFMLDYDGTLYQTVDLAHNTAHGDFVNPIAIGIEINNYDKWQVLRSDKNLIVDGAPVPASVHTDDDFLGYLDGLVKRGRCLKETLPGGRTAYRVACTRGVHGSGELLPSVCSFNGFVVGRFAIWRYDEATEKKMDAYKKAVKENKALAADGKPEKKLPEKPARDKRFIEEGFSGRHIQADYSEAQHRTLLALAAALTSTPSLSIPPKVMGGGEHAAHRFALPEGDRVLKDLEHAVEGWHGGVTSHCSVSPGSRWDPGPALRWEALTAHLGGEAAVDVPEVPERIGTRHHGPATPVLLLGAYAAAGTAALMDELRRRAVALPPEDATDDPAEARAGCLDGKALSLAPVQAAQFRLAVLFRLKYIAVDPGPADGVLRPSAVEAIRAFQEKAGLLVTAKLDRATRDKLREVYAREVEENQKTLDGGGA
jgi:hypothetical protein